MPFQTPAREVLFHARFDPAAIPNAAAAAALDELNRGDYTHDVVDLIRSLSKHPEHLSAVTEDIIAATVNDLHVGGDARSLNLLGRAVDGDDRLSSAFRASVFETCKTGYNIPARWFALYSATMGDWKNSVVNGWDVAAVLQSRIQGDSTRQLVRAIDDLKENPDALLYVPNHAIDCATDDLLRRNMVSSRGEDYTTMLARAVAPSARLADRMAGRIEEHRSSPAGLAAKPDAQTAYSNLLGILKQPRQAALHR